MIIKTYHKHKIIIYFPYVPTILYFDFTLVFLLKYPSTFSVDSTVQYFHIVLPIISFDELNINNKIVYNYP